MPNQDGATEEIKNTFKKYKKEIGDEMGGVELSNKDIDGGVKQLESGRTPVNPDNAKSNKDLVALALMQAIPTVVGGLVGGYQGGAIGAQAGQQGVQFAMSQQEKEKAEQMAAADKKEKDDRYNREFALKEAALGAQQRAAQMASRDKLGKTEREILYKYSADPTTKNTKALQESYGKIKAGTENPSPAGDITLVFNFMKMNDPTSTVREGEYATAAQAGSLNEKMGLTNLYNKLVGGETLNPSQRADFLRQSENLYRAQLGVQASTDQFYGDIADRAGVDRNILRYPFAQPTPVEQPKSLADSNGGSPLGVPSANAAAAPVPETRIVNGVPYIKSEGGWRKAQ